MKVRLAIICTKGHWEGQAPQSDEQIHEVQVDIPLEPGWEVQRVMVCEYGGVMKLTIDDLGYVEEMRQRLGLEPDDTSRDKEIESMTPMNRVFLLAGWFHGDGDWAWEWKHYFESQGLYLTTNPEADGVLE